MEFDELILLLAKTSLALCFLSSAVLVIATLTGAKSNLTDFFKGAALGFATTAMMGGIYVKMKDHSSRHDGLQVAINECKTAGGQPALTLDRITFHMSTDRFLCLDRGTTETSPLNTSGAE